MEAIMKNTLKRLSLMIAAAALFFAGAANLYAMDGVDHWPSSQGEQTYERFLDIDSGNGNF